ncbi:MAG: histidinol-phosphate transaminase [bacterium]
MWIENYLNPKAYNLQRYKAGKPIEEIKREIFGNKEVRILKLASNENLAGIDNYVLKKLKQDLKNLYYYPDDSMYYTLEALSQFYKIPKDRMVLGNGAVELIRYIYQILIKEGDIIFSPHPTFAIYYIDSNLFGAQHLTYNLQPPDYSIKAHDILQNLQTLQQNNKKVKMLVICSPNNPTGTIITNTDLIKVMDYCKDEKIIVVLDEAYLEFVDHPDYHDGLKLLEKYENLIVIRTFSKVFALAGLRVGVAFSNPYITKALSNIRLPFNVNTLAQKALIYSLEIYPKIIKKIKKIIKEKHFMYKELTKAGIEYIPTYANFIAIKVDDHMRVYNELLKRGIIVRPASDMNMGSYIRVTISHKREENVLFLGNLKKVVPVAQLDRA